ncbi:purine-nucleoside phosphorylase [Bogoriella caseilytica]|uniref:Purine nucleoside phosphorylase n=1 Tax=Bogoriella caseilytica TaxID=56055 RepID=A0A3N2BEK1_9MICO|nr:purine-nucleoside phosphorylase [Bogoriella caseilytica]ROR73686.1 purine-nucleoside phosphorylase [Bogoriella caseilytica]
MTTPLPSLDDPATDPREIAAAAAREIAARSGVDRHDLALVLGSGWGGAADLLGETVADLPAEELPGFSAPVVPGHGGRIRSIRLSSQPSAEPSEVRHALVLGARTHYYEGKGVRRVAHAARVASACGASTLVLTNGCGSVRREWGPGSVVLVSDHLNLTGTSPLEGATFVDLTDLYSARLRGVAREVDADLPEGVYAQFRGPHYETPAEVRMAGVMGADLVGMSTALEAIAAREAGLEVLGLSLVTNLAAGVSAEALSHEEVLQAGSDAGPRISRLLAEIAGRL